MKTNVKEITINIECDVRLKRINSTPTLKNLFRSNNLVVGDNVLRVNHFNYSEILRMDGCLFTVKNQNL